MQRNRMTEAASVKRLVATAIIIGSGSYASAQDDVGKMQYQSSCAACHGIDAKGGGPVSKELKTRPAEHLPPFKHPLCDQRRLDAGIERRCGDEDKQIKVQFAAFRRTYCALPWSESVSLWPDL
jgi:cytochrome c